MSWTEALPDDVCAEALDWAETQPDAATAWQTCERGDRMLCALGQLAPDDPESEPRRKLTLTTCECVRPALRYIPGDARSRSRIAIETAERWARREGGVTLEQVRAAAEAAYFAYFADAAAYAADAADAAAKAAFADANAAKAAANAAKAAAAYFAAADAAKAAKESLRASADIVRKHYPQQPLEVRP